MKFAKQYTEAYRDLPPTWPAFQYKALKKTIGKIVQELEDNGIFHQPGSANPGSPGHESGDPLAVLFNNKECHVEYSLEADAQGALEPCVIITFSKPAEEDEELARDGITELSLDDPLLGSPTLSPTGSDGGSSPRSRPKVVTITISKTPPIQPTPDSDTAVSPQSTLPPLTLGAGSLDDAQPVRFSVESPRLPPSSDPSLPLSPPGTPPKTDPSSVKYYLKTDHEFFAELAAAVNGIATFETSLQDTFRENLDTLSRYLVTAASPYAKDMYAWRRLLSTYLQSEIWLVGGTKDRALLSSKQQLEQFDEIARKNLRPMLKSKDSAVALEAFLALNREMLAVKQFDEINHTAVRKILKKHDKRTQLAAAPEYGRFSEGKTFFVDNVARALIFAVQERLTTVIPQPEDYACPICQEISWKPIRLVCGHVFCVRCLVKAQVRRVQHCPICRADGAVENATPDQLDVARMNLLKLYFPKETKQKARDSGQERAAEDMEAMFGPAIAGTRVASAPSPPTPTIANSARSLPAPPATGAIALPVDTHSDGPSGSQDAPHTTRTRRGSGQKDGCIIM
ncbi:hypothetical protein HKX48_001504 [Thoreauomyces humboldtii]|nr:hypothetical protein HKX48_001504 [Thoreauomyces humboldtii]